MPVNPNQVFQEDYTTPPYVTNAINNVIGETSGTVTSIYAGNGLTITGSSSPITISGTIGLCAQLSDLNNVTQPSTISENQVLTWNGTCWYPATFSGTGISPIAFTDLSDTPSHYTDSYLLQSTSNSINYIPNNYISSIANGIGIGLPVKTGEEVQLEVDLNTFEGTNISQSTDEFIILKNNGTDQLRIAQSEVSIENFNGAISFVQTNARYSLSANSPIVYENSTGVISLTGSVMTGIDFDNYPISGVLPIEHGGTSSSTSFNARVNLGLSYNTDILAFNDPHYNGFMRGTNVRFAPGTASINISFSGSGYTPSHSNYINYNGKQLFLNILTGPDGEICSASLDKSYYDTLLYSKYNIPVYPPSSGTAYVEIIPEDSYINFGLSQQSEGIGFRNKEGYIEYKYNEGVSWFQLEKFINTITGMNDVSVSSLDNDNILIYKDGVYQPTVLTGGGFINNGKLVISGPIDPTLIMVPVGISPININQFGTLEGISSNIQDQLNNKIHSYNTPTNSSVLYYDSSTSFNAWQSLPAGDTNSVLTLGTSTLEWDNPFNTIGSSMIPEADNTYDIGTSTKKWKNTFTDILNLGIYTVGSSPSGICGSLTVFSDGNYGQPCLGLYWDNQWNIIGMSGAIST